MFDSLNTIAPVKHVKNKETAKIIAQRAGYFALFPLERLGLLVIYGGYK